MTIDRKSLKRPDEFMKALGQIFEGLAQRPKLILFLLGFLATGVALGFWLTQQRDEKLDAARDALYTASQSLEKERAQLREGSGANSKKSEKAAPSKEEVNVDYQKIDVDARFKKSIPLLQEVAHQFEKTRPGFDAMVLLGELYFNHGQPEKAKEWFEKSEKAAPGNFEKAEAIFSIGHSYEKMGQTQEALQSYERASLQGQAVLKGELLLAIARCYEKMKDLEKAKTTYERIISEMGDSPHAETAKQFLSLL